MSVTPRLQVSDTQGRRIVPLDKPLFRIGRRHESELQIVSVDVSREHAEIEQDGNGGWLLRDRGSRCGTFVNNKPVTERVLAHGDQIRLGRRAVPNWCSCWTTPSTTHGTEHLGGRRFPAGRVAARRPARARIGPRARRSARARDGFGHRCDRRRARIHHARERGRRARVHNRPRARARLAARQALRDEPEDSAAGVRHGPRDARRT